MQPRPSAATRGPAEPSARVIMRASQDLERTRSISYVLTDVKLCYSISGPNGVGTSGSSAEVFEDGE